MVKSTGNIHAHKTWDTSVSYHIFKVFHVLNLFWHGSGSVSKFGLDPDPKWIFAGPGSGSVSKWYASATLCNLIKRKLIKKYTPRKIFKTRIRLFVFLENYFQELKKVINTVHRYSTKSILVFSSTFQCFLKIALKFTIRLW